jgi:hypothetical protein
MQERNSKEKKISSGHQSKQTKEDHTINKTTEDRMG